jgi:hypothetical protein
MYSSTLSLTSVLRWVRVVSATPRPLYSLERPGTHSIGGWVGPRAGLDPISVTSILISSSPLRLGLSCGLPHQNAVCVSLFPHTYHVPGLYFFFSSLWRFGPILGYALPFRGLASTHWIHQTRYNSSGRVISPTQRPLHGNTQHSQETYPCPRRHSNPQSQRASSSRLTP